MRPLAPVACLIAALLVTGRGWAEPSPSALCRGAIAAAERELGIPDRLMQAIGVVESGRRDERGGVTAWPWTINVEGTGYVFDTKPEAIAAVNAHRARGARSIDVGCMQVNLLHHGDAFGSLEQAFDPAANARYAAQFLQRLLAQTGSWPRAAAGYHSLTPDVGAEYARKVLAVWARPGLGEPVPFQRSTAQAIAALGGPAQNTTARTLVAQASPAPGAIAGFSSAPHAPAFTGAALPNALGPRILPAASTGSTAAIGRGLDAYRAAPTRLATNLFLPRG